MGTRTSAQNGAQEFVAGYLDGYLWDCEEPQRAAHTAEDLLDALAESGYVVIQLPDASTEDIADEDRPKRAGDYLKRSDTRSEVWVEGIPGSEPYVFFGRRHMGPSYFPAEYARDLAAALLAAAVSLPIETPRGQP